MSDDNTEPTQEGTTPQPPAAPSPERATSGPSWRQIHSDLKDALATWEGLAADETRLSPEEEKLDEMRQILQSLKEKLRELDS